MHVPTAALFAQAQSAEVAARTAEGAPRSEMATQLLIALAFGVAISCVTAVIAMAIRLPMTISDIIWVGLSGFMCICYVGFLWKRRAPKAHPDVPTIERSECPCGQTFAIPPNAGPRTWSCHSCGRKLWLSSDGQVREFTLPKREDDEHVTAQMPHLEPARPKQDDHVCVPARIKDLPSPEPTVACSTCGIALHSTCAWCGQAHCWLHIPPGHPAASQSLDAVRSLERLTTDLGLVQVLCWLGVAALCLLVWAWLN